MITDRPDRTLRKIRIFQPDAYLAVDCYKRELSITSLDGAPRQADGFPEVVTQKMTYPGRDPLADQIASFVNSVIHRGEPVVSGQDGRRALKYALGIIDQIEQGCSDFRTIC